jgi:hypothetical protein
MSASGRRVRRKIQHPVLRKYHVGHADGLMPCRTANDLLRQPGLRVLATAPPGPWVISAAKHFL